jgi:hypothetical protein
MLFVGSLSGTVPSAPVMWDMLIEETQETAAAMKQSSGQLQILPLQEWSKREGSFSMPKAAVGNCKRYFFKCLFQPAALSGSPVSSKPLIWFL